MANLNRVVYLSEAQKNTLFTTGSVTSNGITITYNENDLYITPQVYDSTPTENSDNLMTSGAIYNAINNSGGTYWVQINGTVNWAEVLAAHNADKEICGYRNYGEGVFFYQLQHIEIVSSDGSSTSDSLDFVFTAVNGDGTNNNVTADNYYWCGGNRGWSRREASAARANHTHGNITNTGDITSTVAIASGDRLVINDESASKIDNSSITFGSSSNYALANNGTWQPFNNYSHPTGAGNNHIPSGGSSGQFLGWSSAGVATWVANPNTDTKQNIVLASTSKAYVTGVTTAPTSTTAAMTGVGDTGVYLTTTAGELSAVRHSYNVDGTEKAYTLFNTATNAIDFVFV